MARKKQAKNGAAASDLPAETLEALQAINAPVDTLLQACQDLGITRQVALGLVDRLAVRKGGFRHGLGRMTTKEMVGSIEERIALVLHYLDEFGVSTATPRDLAIILGILIEKRQLLRGEPTQIMSVNERQHLEELVPALIEEARLRGMTVDLTPADYREVHKDGMKPRVMAGTAGPGDADAHAKRGIVPAGRKKFDMLKRKRENEQ